MGRIRADEISRILKVSLSIRLPKFDHKLLEMVLKVFECEEFKEEEAVLMVFMVIKSNSDWASFDSK